MKRYICDNVYEEESPDGEWVRYEDHVAELALLMRPLVEPKHTPDPKHLPPRDCLVELDGAAFPFDVKTITVHVIYVDDGGNRGWFSAETGDELDVADVITWRELPEVE